MDMNEQMEFMKKYWDENTVTHQKAMYIVNSSKADWEEDKFIESGKPVWDDIYASVKEHLPDHETVIDLGCGLSRVLLHTRGIFGRSFGVDINANMIEYGLKNYKGMTLSTLPGTGEMQCFASGKFSFVYSWIMFQHIPFLDVQQQYIREIERVLKPNGIAGLLVQNPCWGSSNNEINLGRGMTLEELKEVTSLEVVSKNDNFRSTDGRNYWVVLRNNNG